MKLTCCVIENRLQIMSCHDQGTEFEFTVFQIPAKCREVQKFNQGSFPKSGGYRFRGSFFVSFFVAHPDSFGGEAKKKNIFYWNYY